MRMVRRNTGMMAFLVGLACSHGNTLGDTCRIAEIEYNGRPAVVMENDLVSVAGASHGKRNR